MQIDRQYIVNVLVAAPLLAVASVPVLFLAAATAITTRQKPIIKQPRYGLHGREFQIYKIRTMRDQVGTDGKLLSDEARLTKLGFWLRRRGLDEVPQLLNILKGDMAFIGPRPPVEPPTSPPLYDPSYNVRPGLTGWGQIKLNLNATYEQLEQDKREHDDYYVKHSGSRRFKLQILFRTARIIFKGQHDSITHIRNSAAPSQSQAAVNSTGPTALQ